MASNRVFLSSAKKEIKEREIKKGNTGHLKPACFINPQETWSLKRALLFSHLITLL